jgi:hypothetical protein
VPGPGEGVVAGLVERRLISVSTSRGGHSVVLCSLVVKAVTVRQPWAGLTMAGHRGLWEWEPGPGREPFIPSGQLVPAGWLGRVAR